MVKFYLIIININLENDLEKLFLENSRLKKDFINL